MSSNSSSRNSNLSHGANRRKEQLPEHPQASQKGTSTVPSAFEKQQSRQTAPTRKANTEVDRRGPSGGLPPRMGENSRSSSNARSQYSSGKSSDERGIRSSPTGSNPPSPLKANGHIHDTNRDGCPRQEKENSCEASALVNGNKDSPVLALQLTQTMHSNANLWCYKIAAIQSTENGTVVESRRPTSMEYLLKTRLVDAKSCIFTDYQKYLISTSKVGHHIEAQESGCFPIKLRLVEPMPWSTMLKFLDSAKFPKDTPKEALIGLYKTLICQMYQSQKSNFAEQKSFKVLDVKYTNSLQRLSLATVIQNFLAEDPKNLRRLETYLKGRQVQVSYQKRVNSTEESKDSVKKSIVGLARVDDALGSKVLWPPRISKYGASSDHVSFFVKPNRKSRTATGAPSKTEITDIYATVAEYFEKNKNHRLKHPDLPVINVGTRRKPTYLPPELCELKDSSTTSEMDHRDLEALAQAVDIHDLLGGRDIKRESLAPGLKLPSGSDASNCYVDVTVASMIASCRLLKSPGIKYSVGESIDTACGSWGTQLLDFAKRQTAQPRKIAVLRFSPSQNAKVIEKEEEVLKETLKSGNLGSKLRKYGILLDEHSPVRTITMQSEKLNKAEQESIHQKLKALAIAKLKPDAGLVVLPKKDRSVYDCVKRQCDIVLGIQSLCVVAFQLTSEANGYYSQVGLKFNLKFKGKNQVLEQPGPRSFTLETTMIVGFDTMIPPIGTGESAKSIATMVSSKDKSLSQWPANVEVLAEKPVLEVFTKQLQAQVDYWKSKNGKYPENIIIYLNGSTARKGQGFPEELSNIQTSLHKITKSERPNLTVIAVSKDHNAQLRTPESLTHDPEAQEIPAKPILVRTAEREKEKTWEFVIQGHKPMKKNNYEEAISQRSSALKASQATLPVRYSVLKNGLFTNDTAQREFEDLTHQMCYLSGHGTSYVTETLPIHYVGLLCKRIHSYVRPWYYPRNGGAMLEPLLQKTVQPHEDIKDTMYYI
ncbi:MAG: hypothetical protein Q9195_006914 [Heterodermia aff. obscurata]